MKNIEDEIEVKIRIFADDKDGHVELINGKDGYVILMTDVDERQIMVNIEHMKLALRKICAK